MLVRRATAVVAETVRFDGGTQIWYPRPEDSLNLGGRDLHCYNLRLMLKISCADCFGLSPVILAQFTLEARNREQFSKTRYFWISRSFNVIDVGTSRKLVSSACYDKEKVCVYLQPFLH